MILSITFKNGEIKEYKVKSVKCNLRNLSIETYDMFNNYNAFFFEDFNSYIIIIT